MDRRNLSILFGILLLVGLVVWISSSNLEYKFPTGTTSGETQQPVPFWAALLPWQGSQQRSIKVHEGLDLQGGLQVVLEADLPPGQQLPEGAMEAVRGIVDNRVNGLGVTEPLIQLSGSNRLIVQLPGISDPDLAISTIRETGLLEFINAGRTPIPDGTVVTTTFGLTQTNAAQTTTEGGGQVYQTIITGRDLSQVSNAGLNPDTRVVEINFSLTPDGAKKFGDYTGANIGRFLCIVLDKRVLSCPVVNAKITDRGTISLGRSSLEQGQALAIQLRYGALPVPLKIVETRSVGPTLGQDSVQKSIRAGIIGLIIVSLFMLINYRMPGFMAVLALAVYGLLNFALYKIIPVTLTLPGITGFILSLGMAVDGNILVFERMKDELRHGRSLKLAMDLGFTRAWPSIRDAAASTLITCVILFWFGSNFGAGVVKGFAVTLAVGVLTHLFTVMTVTRAFLHLLLGISGESLKDSQLLIGFNRHDTTEAKAPGWATGLFDIVGKRKWYYLLSAVVIVPGLIGMIFSTVEFKSPLKLGIDFTSGSEMELQFNQPVQPAQVRNVFTSLNYDNLDLQDTTVTTSEQLGQQTIIVRSKYLDQQAKVAVQSALRSKFGDFKEIKFDSVGPAIGQEVTRAAGYAIAAAAIAIQLYLVFAFRSVPNAFRYGVTAIIAMLHDILVTAGLFAIATFIIGWEVDALFLTALLTMIGYSVHDSIIVFDRLRENLPKWRMEPFDVVCNRSILETVTRSLTTSLCTAFVVISILAFGGATVRHFTAVILVGIITGTYSSIFNAVALLVSWRHGEIGNFFRRLIGRPPVTATPQG